MSNVPVPQETLDSWAQFVNRVRVDVHPIRLQITRGDYDGAKESLEELRHEAARVLTSMREAGAARPGGIPEPPPSPLHLLHTEASVWLVRALEEAYTAAQAVDCERFASGAEHVGDVHAQPVRDLLARWRQEVFGPEGKD